MVIKKHSFYKKSLIKHPFIFKLIFITCFVGIIIGIVIGGRFNKINYGIENSEKTFFTVFFNNFTYNFWYFFLIWVIGFIPIGFIFDLLILLIKSIIIGISSTLILKADGITVIFTLIKLYLPELLIIFPSFIYLCYKSIIYSSIDYKFSNSQNNYFNIILILSFCLILASILTALNKEIIIIK